MIDHPPPPYVPKTGLWLALAAAILVWAAVAFLVHTHS